MIIFWLGLFFSSVCHAVSVPGGSFQPLFADKGEDKVQIKTLEVDLMPVTNEQYLAFLRNNPKWTKSRITSLTADASYLKHWIGDLLFPSSMSKHPVVYVSWFAARAYCAAQGARLPSILEWEYFADASSPEQEDIALKWYAKGQDAMRSVGGGKANRFGLYDTSGLIWEWVEDFQSAIMSGDSRNGPNRDMFCGGAALNSKNPKQYAAFIRYALRASLKGNYTTAVLGFRCVK